MFSDSPHGVAPACDVCVVTYNSAGSISRLLMSLSCKDVRLSVHVIDNASQDATVDLVRRVADQLKLSLHITVLDENRGFPAACNELLRTCTADVIAVLNPDVELTPGALRRLVDEVRSNPDVGVAGCRQMTRDGRPQSEPARRRPRLRRLLAGSIPRWMSLRAGRLRDTSSARLFADLDVECMSGALMVFRRSLLDGVGYLDTSVFMYLEDIDYAARVRAAGYRIRYLGSVWVWHDSGVSARGSESRLYALLPQVWLTYFKRYGSAHERLAARPVLFFVCLTALVSRLARFKLPSGELLALRNVATYHPVATPQWSDVAHV